MSGGGTLTNQKEGHGKTQGEYPEEFLSSPQHSESLKSRTILQLNKACKWMYNFENGIQILTLKSLCLSNYFA